MKYLYSVYDAKTGELAYKGKAGQLVAAGVFHGAMTCAACGPSST